MSPHLIPVLVVAQLSRQHGAGTEPRGGYRDVQR
jgi:hypothetical protein